MTSSGAYPFVHETSKNQREKRSKAESHIEQCDANRSEPSLAVSTFSKTYIGLNCGADNCLGFDQFRKLSVSQFTQRGAATNHHIHTQICL